MSRTKFIDGHEPFGRQRMDLQKLGGVAAGMLMTYVSDNLCFERTVIGDRIVHLRIAHLPHADEGAQAPADTDAVLQVSDYVVEFGDSDNPDVIDGCERVFFDLTASSASSSVLILC